MRSYIVVCSLLLAISLTGCGGKTSPVAARPVATQWLLPHCAHCQRVWNAYGKQLQQRTRLRAYLIGKPHTVDSTVAALSEAARARNKMPAFLNTWFTSMNLAKAAAAIGIAPAHLSAVIKHYIPAANKVYRAAKRLPIRIAPTLIVQNKAIAVLRGEWTQAELNKAIRQANDG